MDAAAPEAAEPPEVAEAATDGRKRSRWRWRVKFPTSIVVTFVGIALTAWLLPAFARQRDDRQKAQELKATIVADMEAATSQALVGGEALWANPPRDVNRAQLADEWSRSTVAIQGKLRTYLPGPVVTAWQIYTWMVDRFVGGHRAQAEVALESAVQKTDLDSGGFSPRDLHPLASSWAATVLDARHARRGDRGPSFAPWCPNSGICHDAVGFLEKAVGAETDMAQWLYITPHILALISALNGFQEEITREVLEGHVAGYSTTTHDLIHDLVPFT